MSQQIEAAPLPEPAPRAERIVYPESPRLRRIRWLSTLMDNSIVLPSGFRIGLDPLVGLLPGIGDALSSLVSCYLVYEAARLGMRKRILALMLGNILLDSAVGSFPVLGDLFDAVWKSNIRNLRLVEKHYRPAQPERPAGRIAASILVFALGLVFGIGFVFYTVSQAILRLFGG
jgi:hypothetical protein